MQLKCQIFLFHRTYNDQSGPNRFPTKESEGFFIRRPDLKFESGLNLIYIVLHYYLM